RPGPLFIDRNNEARHAAAEGGRIQQGRELDAAHPALRDTKRFAGVKFFRYAPWDAAEANVLARLADGSPLLTEQTVGSGRVLVLASPFDNIWNDLPVHPVFVPFVAESAACPSAPDETADRATLQYGHQL